MDWLIGATRDMQSTPAEIPVNFKDGQTIEGQALLRELGMQEVVLDTQVSGPGSVVFGET